MNNFFSALLTQSNLIKHDGRPLWKYAINHKSFQELKEYLISSTLYSIDPRSVALYYAQWWNVNYNGGKPSKQEIFDSIWTTSPSDFTEDEFYKLARKGAEMLGIKWIKKQNTLYFKTLLLQGGLPLKHISQNQGRYKEFLEAVLNEQPETIEDFMFKNHIIDLLPKSSQNDTIYENCLEIVKSILNGDGQYDDLLESESLKEISKSLKIKSASLIRKIRQSKPKNYWLLTKKNNQYGISLRLGLADIYTKDSLGEILGFEATERTYQFFINDDLVCVFRKMVNGKYKTDWYNQVNIEWTNYNEELPDAYVISNEKKIELLDFINSIPSLEEPSLWVKFTDNQWRFTKGYTSSIKEAALLMPTQWKCNRAGIQIELHSKSFSWLPFEGEIEISYHDRKQIFNSGVSSFEWVIRSKKPKWMLRSNMPVVQGNPHVLVYDEHGYDIKGDSYKVSIKKHGSLEPWESNTKGKQLSVGCFDLKIEKGGLIAHDVFFNIGSLKIRPLNQTIQSAQIEINNPTQLELTLLHSPLIETIVENNIYTLKVIDHSNIPSSIKVHLGIYGKRHLIFDLISPFQGMAITDKNGQIISEEQDLSLANLYGMRIISTSNLETALKIQNSLKRDVAISKEIIETTQPLISYKEEIVRLYYLSDAMDFRNTVTIELSEGRKKQSYKISGFSHTLDVSNQLLREVSIYNSNDTLELFAVPINCPVDKIEPIPLLKNDQTYEIPLVEDHDQFIIVSSKIEGNQLMPRFIHTNDFFVGIDKNERIHDFHAELFFSTFKDEIWMQLLAYYNICVQFDIPFSTFDHLRAISRSSEVAARAFFLLGVNQPDPIEYIQKDIPEMEKDLGFCFHWISKLDWENAITEINEPDHFKYHSHIAELLSSYMYDNGLKDLFKYISGTHIEADSIHQSNVIDMRSQLGTRVLDELPYNSPKIKDNYGIQIEQNHRVKLLLQAPIAVAESITSSQKEYPIWGGDEKREVIRRNIQYCQYIKPDFYNKIILHVLKRS
jgi:hypothetical protein